MPKYIEDANTFQIVDDAGKPISSFAKDQLNENTLAALKKTNQPFEQPQAPVGRREGAASLIQDLGLNKPAAPAQTPAPVAQSNLQASVSPNMTAIAAAPLEPSQVSRPLTIPQSDLMPRKQMTETVKIERPEVFAEDTQALKNLDQAEKQMLRGIEAEKNIAIESANAQAEVLKNNEQKLQELEAAKLKQIEENELKNKAAQDEFNAKYDEFTKGGEGEFFGTKGTANQITAALSIALGAVGAGLAGGQNQALNLLIKNAENAANERMKKYSAAEDKLAKTKEFGAQALADKNLMIASIYDQIANKAKEMGIKSNSKIAMANADKLAAEFMSKSSLLKQDVLGKFRGKQDIVMQEKEMPVGKLENAVPGFGVASSADDAKKMKEILQQSKLAKNSIDDLLQLADKPFSSLNPNDKAKSDVLRQSLVGQLRVALTGPGAMSEGDRKLLESIIADPTAFFSLTSSNKTKLNELKKTLDRAVASHAEAYGLTGKKQFDVGAPVK